MGQLHCIPCDDGSTTNEGLGQSECVKDDVIDTIIDELEDGNYLFNYQRTTVGNREFTYRAEGELVIV